MESGGRGFDSHTWDFFLFFQHLCNDSKSNLLSSLSSMKKEQNMIWNGKGTIHVKHLSTWYLFCFTSDLLFIFRWWNTLEYVVWFSVVAQMFKKRKKNRACGSRTRVLHSPFSIKACCTLPSQSSNQCTAAMVKSGFDSPKLYFFSQWRQVATVSILFFRIMILNLVFV